MGEPKRSGRYPWKELDLFRIEIEKNSQGKWEVLQECYENLKSKTESETQSQMSPAQS